MNIFSVDANSVELYQVVENIRTTTTQLGVTTTMFLVPNIIQDINKISKDISSHCQATIQAFTVIAGITLLEPVVTKEEMKTLKAIETFRCEFCGDAEFAARDFVVWNYGGQVKVIEKISEKYFVPVSQVEFKEGSVKIEGDKTLSVTAAGFKNYKVNAGIKTKSHCTEVYNQIKLIDDQYEKLKKSKIMCGQFPVNNTQFLIHGSDTSLILINKQGYMIKDTSCTATLALF
jgi:hypothetical protein